MDDSSYGSGSRTRTRTQTQKCRRGRGDWCSRTGRVAGCVLLAYLVLTPLKLSRYFAPGGLVLLCAAILAIASHPKWGRRLLGMVLVFILMWRVVFITEAVPWRPWLRGSKLITR